MFIETISFSKSSTFSQCKLKYNYKYVQRINGDKPRNEDSLNFGSYIHKVLEEGVEAKCMKDLQSLAEQHKKRYKIPFSYKEKTNRCLSNFLNFNGKLGETVATELMYEVSLDKKHSIKQNGIIDRVIKGSNGGYLIIDYKTSKREKNKFELFKDKQLQGYCFAISETFNVPTDKIVCAHYYPVTGHFVDVKYSRGAIAQWKREEIEKSWCIRKAKSKDMVASENQYCNWCEYHDMCPLFVPTQHMNKRIDEQKALKTKKK